MNEKLITERDLNIYNAGAAGIHRLHDLIELLESIYEPTSSIDQIVESFQKHSYRNNKFYLRFLGSILTMPAEFGYDMITLMLHKNGRIRRQVEMESQRDFLDPRNLVHFAIRMAEIIKSMNAIRLDLIDQRLNNSQNLKVSNEELLRIMCSWIRPEHGNITYNPTAYPNTYLFISTRFDDNISAYEQKIYYPDLKFVESILNIGNYDLVTVRTMTKDTFNIDYLNPVILAFPGIDIESIFETEFFNNP